MPTLKAPFPWFGGKSAVADIVWQRFGAVRNYVEPFAGSLACLLARPQPFEGTETVNDLDGMIANFWRALAADPDAVAEHADWPVNENDLHARHIWLVNQKDSLQSKLEGDPEYYDAKIAGWWVWGICCWIGGGWCSGRGPWSVVNGELVKNGDAGLGVNRKLVHIGDAGRGVNRQLVHDESGLQNWMRALAERLKLVRVCCGDWARVCTPVVTTGHGMTAVFLDPPYADTADRDDDLYNCDSLTVAHAVREWAIANGGNKLFRICLCGYEGEHVMPDDWSVVEWKAQGGYGNQKDGECTNRHKERLWFSPHCVKPRAIKTLAFAD